MIRFATMMVLCAGMCACQSTPAASKPAHTAAGVPAPFTVELRSMGESRKVMYRLDEGGELSYGGGRDAVLGEPPVVGQLKPDQIAGLWKFIQDRKLMNASGAGLFTKAEKVKYNVKLRAGDQKNSFDAVDDKTPGVAELDQLLFKMAGDLRYNSVFKPIDEQIKKSGGAVKQQK